MLTSLRPQEGARPSLGLVSKFPPQPLQPEHLLSVTHRRYSLGGHPPDVVQQQELDLVHRLYRDQGFGQEKKLSYPQSRYNIPFFPHLVQLCSITSCGPYAISAAFALTPT